MPPNCSVLVFFLGVFFTAVAVDEVLFILVLGLKIVFLKR